MCREFDADEDVIHSLAAGRWTSGLLIVSKVLTPEVCARLRRMPVYYSRHLDSVNDLQDQCHLTFSCPSHLSIL